MSESEKLIGGPAEGTSEHGNDFEETSNKFPENGSNLQREDVKKKTKVKTSDLEQSHDSASSESAPEDVHLSDNSSEYSFRNARLIFKRDAFGSTPEEEEATEATNKIPLKRTESRVTKMVEKCAKAVGDIASGIKSSLKANLRRSLGNESMESATSSFEDNSGAQSDSSSEVAKKYRKLLNNEKERPAQDVQLPEDHSRTEKRKLLQRQDNVEGGVEMEAMPDQAPVRNDLPDEKPHEEDRHAHLNMKQIPSTKPAYERFCANLTLTTDSDDSSGSQV